MRPPCSSRGAAGNGRESGPSGLVPQAARSRGWDRSETGSNPSPLGGRPLQHRDTHCLGHRVIAPLRACESVIEWEGSRPLPDPSLGTIAPEARELVATARSRAPANPSATSEWPCTRPNFARNPSSPTGDGRRRTPEIGNGGIATEQFIRSWVATRKASRSSAAARIRFDRGAAGDRSCRARLGSGRTLANEHHRSLFTRQGPRCCWREQSGSRRLHSQGATGAGRGSHSICTRDAVSSVGWIEDAERQLARLENGNLRAHALPAGRCREPLEGAQGGAGAGPHELPSVLGKLRRLHSSGLSSEWRGDRPLSGVAMIAGRPVTCAAGRVEAVGGTVRADRFCSRMNACPN